MYLLSLVRFIVSAPRALEWLGCKVPAYFGYTYMGDYITVVLDSVNTANAEWFDVSTNVCDQNLFFPVCAKHSHWKTPSFYTASYCHLVVKDHIAHNCTQVCGCLVTRVLELGGMSVSGDILNNMTKWLWHNVNQSHFLCSPLGRVCFDRYRPKECSSFQTSAYYIKYWCSTKQKTVYNSMIDISFIK